MCTRVHTQIKLSVLVFSNIQLASLHLRTLTLAGNLCYNQIVVPEMQVLVHKATLIILGQTKV